MIFVKRMADTGYLFGDEEKINTILLKEFLFQKTLLNKKFGNILRAIIFHTSRPG
jgi:hypothetical protein